MKFFIFSAILAICFTGCKQNKVHDDQKPFYLQKPKPYKGMKLSKVMDVKTKLVITYPDGTEAVAKVFDTPPQPQSTFPSIKLEDGSEVALTEIVAIIRADITLDDDGDGVSDRMVTHRYVGQQPGDFIESICGNPVRLMSKK